MDIIIKKMALEDLEDTLKLCDKCFDEKTDVGFAKKTFLEYEKNENHIYLIAKVEQRIVGHLKITVVPTIYGPMATYAILNHVCVDPEYRRHHIGTKLLDEATDICKKNGCKTVELWSKNFREAAHAMYKKYGFIAQDAVYFKKEL